MFGADTNTARGPKAAFSDFEFVRIVIDFIGDLANSLNALLVFIQNLLSFGS
jgi:hypothetical protein